MEKNVLKNIDVKEVELPTTEFIFDIETKVLQSFCYQVIKKTEGVYPVEGGIIDNLLGHEHLKGIHVSQDSKAHAVLIKIEVGVEYGMSLPQVAEELQSKIVEEISEFTGLHVGSCHVIFKNLIVSQEKQVSV
jgi:uncharacterized alkaline shock family protein YloU